MSKEDLFDINLIESALDFANMYVWVLDVREIDGNKELIFRYVSKGIEKFIDVKSEDLIGKPSNWIDYVHPDDRYILINTRKNILRDKEIHEVYRIIDKKGKVRWVEGYVYAIISERGKLKGLRGYTIDITDKIESKQRLERSNKYLGILYSIGLLFLVSDDAKDVIDDVLKILSEIPRADRVYWFELSTKNDEPYMVKRAEWRKRGISPQVDNIYLKNSSSDIGLSFYMSLSRGEIFHERISDVSDPYIKKLLESQGVKTVLLTPIYIKGKYSGFLGIDNTHSEVFWNYEDISFLKATSEMFGNFLLREKRTKELEELFLRFKTLMEEMPVLIAFRDKKGRWIYVNQATEEYLDLKDIDYKGKTTLEISKLLKDKGIKRIFENGAISDKEVFETGENLEYPVYYEKNGKGIYLIIKKTPIYDKNKNMIGILVVGIDVTKEKEKEREREEMLKRLMQKQKLEGMGLMASGIAHDFNNILTIISGNVSILEELEKNKTNEKYLKRIQDAIDRAKSLIEIMLTYTGRREASQEIIELNSEIRKIYDLVRAVIPKTIDVKVNYKEKPLYVYFDPSQFQQVIMNLLINAGEAIGEEQGSIIITIDKKGLVISDIEKMTHPMDLNEGTYALVEVKDSGPGISKDILDSVFDPFFSTKSSGRGLGLSILFGIVKTHKGGINVITEKGKGTAFQIFLPLSERKEPRDESGRFIDLKKDRDGESLRILIVDDESWIREVLSEVLSIMGHLPETAEDGYKALRKIEANPDYYDLVIIDYSMPGMNGFETFMKIKDIAPSLPVILSSGFIDKDISQDAKRLGAGFIYKPYKVKELERAIKEIMKNYR